MERIRGLARVALLLWHLLAWVRQTVGLVKARAMNRALIHTLVEQILIDYQKCEL